MEVHPEITGAAGVEFHANSHGCSLRGRRSSPAGARVGPLCAVCTSTKRHVTRLAAMEQSRSKRCF